LTRFGSKLQDVCDHGTSADSLGSAGFTNDTRVYVCMATADRLSGDGVRVRPALITAM